MENMPDRSHAEAHKKVRYFLPGQIILHIEHPANITQEKLANALEDFLSGETKAREEKKQRKPLRKAKPKDEGEEPEGQRWKRQLEPPAKESILTFPLQDDKGFVFSIVRVNLRDRDVSQDDFVKLLKTIHAAIPKDGSLIISDNITLNFVSLNWLVSDAHHGTSTGGPSSWPVEAHPPLEDHWKFQWQDPKAGFVSLPFQDGQGTNIHVAILDTVPTRHAMDTAYAERRWQHRLIESMLRPTGPLHLYPATVADFSTLPPTAEYSVRGHRYWMRDHGLFVAGIIHTIAPKATLHLVEVLNPYGVGSMQTIAQGLKNALENTEIKRPLIINCSFTLNIPVEGVKDEDFPQELRDPAILAQEIAPIKEVFRRVAAQKNVVVVACAGNDAKDNNSNPNGNRPHARYPAAFDTVQGVGALSGISSGVQYQVATYSNLSDEPPTDGYITLGGDPGSEKGVLGVYIDEFPIINRVEWFLRVLWRFLRLGPGRPGHLPRNIGALTLEDIEYKRNTTGWAWWSGTSFGAPIVSGLLATWRSQPANRTRPFQLRHIRPVLNGFGPSITSEGEHIILVRQEA